MTQAELFVLMNLIPIMRIDPRLRFHTFTQDENIYNHKEKGCPKCELNRLIAKNNGQ